MNIPKTQVRENSSPFVKFNQGKLGDFLEDYLNFFSAMILIILSLPLLVLSSFLVLIFTGKPVYIKQSRVGKDNKNFQIYKLRTMHNNSRQNSPTKYKDKRVTKIGKYLRKYYIDELPQLFNVVKREMNLIGPRPERPVYVKLFEKNIPGYQERHSVRPGITGWQQVNICYAFEKVQEKQRLDIFYIKNKNFLFDLKIALLTIKTIVKGKGRF